MGDLIIHLIAELIFILTFIWFSYWTFPIRGILSLCSPLILVTFYHHYIAFTAYVIWYIVSVILVAKVRKLYKNSTLILCIWYVFSSFILHCILYTSSIDKLDFSTSMITGFASILLFVDLNTLKYKKKIGKEGPHRYILNDFTSLLAILSIDWSAPDYKKVISRKKLVKLKSSLENILNDAINKYNIIENIYNTNIKITSLINLLQNCSDDRNKTNNIYIIVCQNINIPQQCLNDIFIESNISGTFNKLDYIIKLKSIYNDRINYFHHILSTINYLNDWQVDNLYNTYCDQELLNK